MLKNKVAIVTGGARGIGKAIVDVFSDWKAKIVVADLIEEEAKEAAQQLRNKNIESIGVKANVAQIDEVENLMKMAKLEFGKIDILVNNAGGGSPLRSIDEIDLDEWSRIINNNLTSTYICCKAVIPYLKEQKYGKIINISSIAGRFYSPLSGPHYASAKAGILGLTRQLAKEIGPFNITINAIAPGTTQTQRVNQKWLNRSEEDRKEFLSMIPLGRLAQPEDIANAVLFFASDLSNYITGVTLDVNGGFYMA